MKANGAHAAAAGAIIQGKVGYKKDLADHAKALQAINRDVATLFPKGSDFGDTNALDGVWSKRADFGSVPRMHRPNPTPSPRPWPRVTRRATDRSSRSWWIPARPATRTTARKK